MKKNYNLTDIMSRAWSIRKSSAASMGCKPSDVLFSICLKMAWAEAEGQFADLNAAAIAADWSPMADADKVAMMKKCIRKAAKNDIGYSIEDRYLQFDEVPAYGLHAPHDLDEFVSETCIRVIQTLSDLDRLTARNQRRAAQGKRPMTLVSVVYNAARASIAAMCYADSKHGAAYDRQVSDDEGNTVSVVETMAADKHQNTEKAAVIRSAFSEYAEAHDEIDRAIMKRVMMGHTEREIAAVVGISNVAVHKRIVKMRAALQELAN